MINPKNKRVHITLNPESLELLNSLSKRYSKSNSEIVKWALNVLAAKKNHNLLIKLREQSIQEEQIQEEPDQELMDKYKDW